MCCMSRQVMSRFTCSSTDTNVTYGLTIWASRFSGNIHIMRSPDSWSFMFKIPRQYTLHCQIHCMLYFKDVTSSSYLQGESTDACSEGCWGWGAGVWGGAGVVEVGGDNLTFTQGPRAVGGCQGGAACLRIPRNSTFLCRKGKWRIIHVSHKVRLCSYNFCLMSKANKSLQNIST